MNKLNIENLIFNELKEMLSSVTDENINSFIDALNTANNIVTIGAGVS